MNTPRECDLYRPIKRHLEAQGFRVRGEVGPCDALAVRGDEMIAVELKLAFGLPVIHQALDRLACVDLVYVGVAEPMSIAGRKAWRRNLVRAVRLCRLLGLGLLSVRGETVSVHAEPGPYRPRRRLAARRSLLREFQGRTGDHNEGGRARSPVVTAYRENALRCAALLADEGALAVAEIRRRAAVPQAGPLLRRNVYGWFERKERGIYALAPAGREALLRFASVVADHRRKCAEAAE